MKPAKPAKVTKIVVSNIDPNPHNPRRLFDEEPMSILRESIKNLGVLVPITVYPKIEGETDPASDRFVILDGERRWRCIISLKMRKIPGIIVERPTETENILVMFHIHNLREDWQLMPTALKLAVLMKQLGEKNEGKLSFLTKISIGQIRRCKILLSYPRKFQNLMLAPPSKRLKSDFFIELHRIRNPARDKKFPPWIKRGDSACVEIILNKYLKKKIKAVTDFRRLAEIYRGSVRLKKTKQFYSALDQFLENEDQGIDSIVVPGATFERQSKEVTRSAIRLRTQLRELNEEALVSNKELVSTLQKLMKLIQKRLEDALLVKRYEDRA